MSRIRSLVAVLAIALPIPAVVAGCGSSSSSSNNEDPNQVLKETFNNPKKVTSGHLNFTVGGSVEGTQSGDFSLSLDGPFQGDASNPNAIPQFDLNGKVNGSASGQSLDIAGGLIATKDDLFVEYQGQAYDIGTAAFKRLQQQSEQQSQAQGNQSSSSLFKQYGIDPTTWLTNVSNEGETDVDGTNTIHVHGDADVANIVSDLGKVVQQTPGSTAQITPQQLDQLKSYVKDATVDVYSGVDDHLLNKLAVALTIEPPAGASSSGISSVKVNFSVTVTEQNQPQTINAPSGAKPIAELFSQLGPLGGALGGGTSSLPGAGSTGGASSGSGTGDAYTKCVQAAGSDIDKINACASKLPG